MSEQPQKHVFISYVRENKEQVDRLCSDLERFGVQIWLDRNDIKPGARWKDAIREAIRKCDFFIGCFSNEYSSKSKAFMNEELTLAIDRLRQYDAKREWFIPVLLSECDVPAKSIGAGETLLDINWVALYEDWDGGIKRILSVIKPISMNVQHLSSELRGKISKKYDVALSFAGEDRSIAREIAESLTKENISVFFVEYSSADLWGRNLFNYFKKVFTDSALCIVLLSKIYSERQWTHNELRNLIAHSLTRPSFSILPIHIGDAPVPKELARFAYFEWDAMSSQELIRVVRERLSSIVPPEPETRQENFHVIKRESGWSVKREGASRAASVHETKKEAITHARKLARRSNRGVIVIHSEDGSIASQEQILKE